MKQLRILIGQFFRAELASSERLLAPLLFAATVLIIFAFAFGQMTSSVQLKVYVAETFLTAFLALQILFSRVFEPEERDRAFDLMRSYPLTAEAWFISKYSVVVVMATLVLIPTMCIAAFFYQQVSGDVLPVGMMVLGFLVILGVSAIGVLTAAMMLKTDIRAFLFPLIYFPLTAPVLICAVQAALEITENKAPLLTVLPNWLGLLMIFDVIYLTLGILLFGELVKSD